MQLEKSISVFRNKTTLSEPIHPSHKTFGLARRILTGLVRPFLEPYRAEEERRFFDSLLPACDLHGG
jgi:hypothetical protein